MNRFIYRIFCHPFSEQEKKLIVDQIFRDLVKEQLVGVK